MATPSVSVGLRKGRVFIIPTYSPGPGTYVHKDPVFESPSSDIDGIGDNVLRGLSEFVDSGEMPDWNVYRSPVLGVADVCTWREYERGLKSCVVDQHEEKFLIRGDRPAIVVPQPATAEEIGNAVLLALGTTKEKESKKITANQEKGQEKGTAENGGEKCKGDILRS